MLKFSLILLSFSIPAAVYSYNGKQDLKTLTNRTPYAENSHPLDPLTAEEILKTKEVIKLQSPPLLSEDYIFNLITLQEPPKSELLLFFLSNTNPPSGTIPRKSFSILIGKDTGTAVEVIVNLDTLKVDGVTPVPEGFQPQISKDELNNAGVVAKNDADVIKRCQDLGYTDMTLVDPSMWSIGYIGDRPEYLGKRLLQIFFFGKNYMADNHDAHPLDFLAVVDLVANKVIGIEDLPSHNGFDAKDKTGTTAATAESNYRPELLPPGFQRQDVPIELDFPEGPSYKVDGYEVQWQKFKMRIGFNGREGLVFYNVNYNDSGIFRPIIYRAAISEMVVPYADPRPPFHRKSVLDMGELGMGINANILKLNQDCIGSVKFFDGISNNSTGDPVTYKNAICIEEEDAGILWKHMNFRNITQGVVIRSHRLSFRFIATIGHYEYIFQWRFYQDASIEVHIELTGIVSVHLLAVNATAPEHGTVVFPQIFAPYHQHFFMARIDTEIDGNLNTVVTSEGVPLDGDTNSTTNPYGQGFTSKLLELKTAKDARTDISPLTSKTWIVTNPNNLNPYTKSPVGWKLMPKNTAPPLMKEDSPLRKKASFIDYDVWVTPYAENQLYAGGYYLNNSGLSEWVNNAPDASVENTDIVLWHNFGLTHITRVEDFPLMPVESTGFWFKPYNFFLQNPGLDVPPADYKAERSEL